MQNQDELFLEHAQKTGKLSQQAVQFCQEQQKKGQAPIHTVLNENFLTLDQVKEIIEQINGENESLYFVTILPDDKETDDKETVESKFLQYIETNEIITQDQIKQALQEQERLQRMGYETQFSAILYGMKILPLEDIQKIYQQILDNSIQVVEDERAPVELGITTIRNYKDPEKNKQPSIAQSVQDALEKTTKGKKKTKKEKMDELKRREKAMMDQEIDNQESYEIDEDLDEVNVEKLAELYEKVSSQERKKHSASNTKEITNQLKEILDTIQNLSQQTTNPTIQNLPQETTNYWTANKVSITWEEAISYLKEGESIQNAYIQDIYEKESNIDFPILLQDCVLENITFQDSYILENVDFTNTIFLGKASFKGTHFQKNAQFNKATFVDGVDFTKTIFQEDTRFNTTKFKKYASFNRSRFEKKAIFSYAYFERGAKFNEVDFNDSASFNDVYCDHRFYLNNCIFQKETSFSNSHFQNIVDFSGSEFFNILKCKGTQFSAWCSFNYAKFHDECYFNGATITQDLTFLESEINSLFDLSHICAEKNINFKDSKIGEEAKFRFLDAYFGRLFLTSEQLEGHIDSHIKQHYRQAQKEYGLLKNNFREINEYGQEDWAYLWEKRTARYTIPNTGILNKIKKFLDWTTLDLSCGYGTKPLNILATALIVIFIFAFIYYIFGTHFLIPVELPNVTSISLADAFQVSFSIFTNASLTTWIPHPQSCLNYIMMIESFFGLFTMSVVVVTFSRKVIR
ncbi:MAG: pentapeptide repeat-containing protein [Planctomycetes bacterium]|nr:pentapeptide repeat-containing protein [Planctomycetota bacterium]